MRFCDLFISYKIGLKDIKSTIPFTKLPLYRKIFVTILFVLSIFKLTWIAYIPLALGVISFIVFLIIDSFKRNLQVMLNEHYSPYNEHYSPYSEKRMQMTVKVLNTYQISIHDFEAIDLLIEEAKIAQIQCDYLAPLKKPLKTHAAIIVPIIVYVAEKIGDSTSQNEMIIMAAQIITIVLLIFSLIFSITPIVKDILYRDYNKYGELIYDLRQIKLFYAKEISSSSN